jgi:transposase
VEKVRRAMVALVRRGMALRAVARRFRFSLDTVRRWVGRAGKERLDRVDFSDRSHAPRRPRRTKAAVENSVVSLREELRRSSDLGEYGAAAIQRELRQREVAIVPSVATINRILERRGALDGHRRVRRPAPPRGWYLPGVAASRLELDSFDIIEDLTIQGGVHVEILNGVSLHGGLVESWPRSFIHAKTVVTCLTEHWRHVGLPGYAQFDNDTRFQGPHNRPNVIGRVARLCLQLGVVPVFAPPQESGFQAGVESFNGRWQLKVWRRFHFESLDAVQDRSARYVTAYRKRLKPRIEVAPARDSFPKKWTLDLQRKLSGRMVFLRRTTEQGAVTVLERKIPVDRHWAHRLVRAEVDLDAGRIQFFALRRRDPAHQPLLREVAHEVPCRPFEE